MKIDIKFIYGLFLTCFYIQVSMANQGILVFDQKKKAQVSYRTMEELGISGSGQLSEDGWLSLLSTVGKKICIVDLRRESHGYLDGVAISWFFPQNKSNVGLNSAQILLRESDLLLQLSKKEAVVIEQISQKEEGKILQSIPVTITPKLIESESELADRLRMDYLRLPVTDHQRPDDEIVDQFVGWVKQQPDDLWLHFHCRGGKGRTTTFMVLYDMLENAKLCTLQEILKRQHIIGAMDIFKISDDPEDEWKKEHQKTRKAFLQLFYEYASHPEGYPILSWKDWLARRNQ